MKALFINTVFHVTDPNGKKFMQDDVADRIQQFQAKEYKVYAVDDSLSEADSLSEMHLLSEASSLLSGLGNPRR